MRFDQFQRFLVRGNVVDLAVAVIVGLALMAVVISLVEDLVTPLIAAIIGEPDFSALVFTINAAEFRYGRFLNALLAFMLILAVVFYLVVTPTNRLKARYSTQPLTDPTIRRCPHCLGEVPRPATRCRFCTAELDPLPLED